MAEHQEFKATLLYYTRVQAYLSYRNPASKPPKTKRKRPTKHVSPSAQAWWAYLNSQQNEPKKRSII